jgi:hypothetical protein
VLTLWLGDVLGGELVFRHGRRVELAAQRSGPPPATPERPAGEDRGRDPGQG